MAPGSLKECHIVVLNATSFRRDYTPSNLKKWIESAGGHVAFKEKITELTTHVVMDEATWADQGSFVEEILTAGVRDSPEQKARTIHVVSFDWLQECLDHRHKRGESSFKWKNLAPAVLKNAARSAKQQAKEEKQPGNVQGLMAQAFLDSTETFVGAAEKKRIEKRKKQDAEHRAEEAEEQKRQFEIYREKMSVPEQAAVFRKGAKRARNEILSDNHHLYVDSTGFTYDVAITKVDFNNNANERYVLTLQIYESNTEPYSYAFNCSFAGTKTLSCNDIIAAIGSNFTTTLRAFKKVFKEKTGVNWDDRIQEYNNREANARMNVGDVEPAFEQMPFEYCPPKYGPVGELPLAQVEAMEAVVQAAKAGKEFRPSPRVDDWKMSGTDGSRNASPSFNEFMANTAKDIDYNPDDKLVESMLEYPFNVPGAGEHDAIVIDDGDTENAAIRPTVDHQISSEYAEFATYKSQKSPAALSGSPTQQAEEQSYQEFPETYEFDDALGVTLPISFPEIANGTPQIPLSPLVTAQSQGPAQTQLAVDSLHELLSGEQTLSYAGPEEQDVTARPDRVNSEAPAAIDQMKAEGSQYDFQTLGEGGKSDDAVDLGLQFF